MGSECDVEPVSCEHGIERDYCGWKVCAKVNPERKVLPVTFCTGHVYVRNLMLGMFKL